MHDDELRTSEIEFAGSDATLRGILALRPGAVRSSLILLPDVRGPSPLYREFAERLASEGYATLVLDVYSREGAPDLPDMESVFRCIAALPDERILSDVADTARHLLEHEETRGKPLGVVGFCLGGQYALMAACRIPELRACVSFYGMLRYDERPAHKPASPLDLAPRLAAPFLGLYGSDDRLITAADRMELESKLNAARVPFGIHVFGGAGHAFANEARPADYRPVAATSAWNLVHEFLAVHL